MAESALTPSTVGIGKLTEHVGAEVTGVDLREPLDEVTFAAIRDAFHAHSVLVFRGQDITDAQQVEFSRRFGELERTSFTIAADNPFVYQLSNVDDAGKVLAPDTSKRTFLEVNARWHTDSSFRAIPAMASVLSARQVPVKEHGDTAFASMRVGYNTLSPTRRESLQGLRGVHSYGYSLSLFGDDHGVTPEQIAAVPPVSHPIVRTHPGTGTRNLFVSGHIERVEGMPVERGRALVKELIDWCTREVYVYRHRWQPYDVVMWDNRCALHRATKIPFTEARIMHRTTIAGEGPVL